MQYDKYELKIKKIEKFFKMIFRHLVKIVAVASFITVTVVALLAARGLITVSAGNVPEIIYGESLPYEAKAFLSEVKYEYCLAGTENWTTEFPMEPGDYCVRAVAKATFGYRYGKVEYFTIKKKPINVEIESSEVHYGSEPTVTAELSYKDRIAEVDFIYNADRTYAEVSSVVIYDENGKDVTSRYDVKGSGKDIVTVKRPITIAFSGASKVYDGTPLIAHHYEIRGGSLVDGERIEVDFPMSQTNAGSAKNTAEYKILNEQSEDVTQFYAITEIVGNLTVEKREITITTGDLSVVYDALYHSQESYIITSEQLPVDGHSVELDGWASICNVGAQANTFKSLSILDEKGTDVSENYDVTVVDGTLEVTPKPVTITTATNSWVYDGEAHSDKGYEAPELVEGHTVNVTESTSIVNVSKVEAENMSKVDNVFTQYEIVDGDGNDVTHNYDVTMKNGTLEITPRPVTITTATNSWVYDGEEHSDTGYEAPELVEGHWIIVADSSSVTNAGKVENIFADYAILDEYGNDVTHNYDVTMKNGTLEITPRPVTIYTATNSWVYDGEAHSDTYYDAPELIGGHTVNVTESTSIINVGSKENEFTAFTIVDEDDNDVTSNYTVTMVNGTLTVTKRPIAITSASAEKVYDGTPLTANYWTTVDWYLYSLVEGHTIKGPEIIGSQTDAGSSSNYYVGDAEFVILAEDGTDVTENYEFDSSPLLGTLTVLPRPATITTDDNSWMYDDLMHSDSGYTADEDGLLDGHTLQDISSATVVDAGEYFNDFYYYVIVDKNGNDVTHNYDVTINPGTLTVTKRPITLVTYDAEKIYDGTALWNYEHDIKGEYGLVDGHRLEIIGSVAIIDAGSIDNELSYVIYDEYYNEKTWNYDVTMEMGTLTVHKRPITVITGDDEKIYDGYPLQNMGYSVGGEYGLLAEHWIDVFDSTSITNAGSVENEFTQYVIVDWYYNDVTNNYDVTMENGTLTVHKRKISVKTNDGCWVYNGEPRSLTECELMDGTSLAYGDYIKAQIGTITTITRVGTTENRFEIVIVGENFENHTGNYDIEVSYGTLEIIPRTISVLSGSRSKKYDGTPLVYHSLLTSGEFETLGIGDKIEARFSGEITEIGVVDNTYDFDSVRIYNGNDDVTYCYEIVGYGFGELKITEDGEEEEHPGIGLPPNLDTNGLIGAPPSGDAPPGEMPVMALTSDTSGHLYLKILSFGEYADGNKWLQAEPYEYYINDYASAQYLTAFALEYFGVPQSYVKIVSYNGEYVVPYYSDAEGDQIQSSDVVVRGNPGDEYYLSYFTWDGMFDMSVPEALAEFEQKYREFVYDQYLKIDVETYSFMQDIIAENGFDRYSYDTIQNVAYYIQNAATYSLDYDRTLDQSENIVIAFLDEYKEGICQHYASAATMLYRALGIPARYTVGYSVDVESYVETEVYGDMAHAWVEVYIDGVGWVAVEVTGGDFGGGGGSSQPKEDIYLIPQNLQKQYDGFPLSYSGELEYNDTLNTLLSLGYSYSMTVGGEQTDIGIGTSYIESFTLYDPNGVDVTDQYNIITFTGELEVYKNAIKVYMYQTVREYDGTSQFCSTNYYPIEMEKGIVLVIHDISAFSLTNVGYITSEDINNNISMLGYSVYREDTGEDVTDQYRLLVVEPSGSDVPYNVLVVNPRSIEITTGSASKNDDGDALTYDYYYISRGSLVEGHTLSLDIVGMAVGKGSVDNAIDISSLMIMDEYGNVVMDNYMKNPNYIVSIKFGKLTIT